MATVGETFTLARRHHQAGRLADAQRLYRDVLARQPSHAGALQLLGVVAHQSGRGDIAIDLIGRALKLDPRSADAHVNLANALKDQGRLDPAIRHYRRALALRPNDADTHYSLGVACQLRGRPDDAATHYERALALRPDIAEALLNLGTIRAEQGDLPRAAECFGRAAMLRPDYLAAQTNLAIVLARQGDREAAAEALSRAAAIAPGDADAHQRLGAALVGLGRFAEAAPVYQRLTALRPDAGAYLNLGSALRELGRLDEATAQLHRALDCDPGFAEAHHSLGLVLQQEGRAEDAVAEQQLALASRPDYGLAHFARCVAELPVVYAEEAEIARRRAAYRERLLRLCADAGRTGAIDDAAAAVGSSQPFFLAYQQQNDRELQAIYGAMACRAMAAKFPAAPSPPRSGKKLRVGIVSGYFCWHTVWKLFLSGWLGQLDRSRFEVFGYHTGNLRDATTAAAAGRCDRFLSGPMPVEGWREAILADPPDILVYPEIGMDGATAALAAQRLAPVQCVAWGHPETTGFPTLDYFLTSAAMEPPNGQDHYTEQLVRLPNLSIYYEPPAVAAAPIGRAELGLRTDAVVFWSPQSLYKYLPRHDCVFAEIADRVGNCQLVFIRFPYGDHVTNIFRDRLDRAFAARGLAAGDYCVFLPPLDQQRFAAAAGQCDIVLDSIGWSGGTTTLESLAHDLPIVAMAGPLMRGRHTSAMLELMDLPQTIAASPDEYVAVADRLARDVEWRTGIRRQIATRKHRLYRDRSCISALEAFFESAAAARS